MLLRTFKLFDVGLFDYDSVWSYLVAKEVAMGQFINLFSHRSPSLYLFYAPFTLLFSDYHWLIVINMCFNIGAIIVFAYWISQKLTLDELHFPFLVLFMGSSLYMVHASRLFSYDNPSLFFAVLSFIYFYNYTETDKKKAFYIAIVFFTISFTFNYKTILLSPLLVGYLILKQREKINLKLLIYGTLIFLSICLIYCIIGFFLGLPIYIYPASFFGFLLSPDLNAANRVGFFSADFDFYFRYLIQYESPLIIISFLVTPWIIIKKLAKKEELKSVVVYLFILCYLFVVLMSFAIKAPRGISFAIPIIYFFSYWVLLQLVKNKWLVITIVILHTIFMDYQAKWNIYDFSQTNYQQLTTYLKNNNISKIGTTLGINCKPFLENENIEVYTLFKPSDSTKLIENKVDYILIDDYYQIAGATNLGIFEQYQKVFEINEPTMQYPMQFLEHAEFNGKNYSEIQLEIDKAKTQNYGLRLVKFRN